jgi:hypothetical protein
MKSITIHGLDDQLDKLIRKRARMEGTSLNKTIKNLLKESLGIKQIKNSDHREDFVDLFGIWSKTDKQKFDAAIKDLAKIDKEEWK